MMGTKPNRIKKRISEWFERCVEYDGYKTHGLYIARNHWFERCVEYDGYKTKQSKESVQLVFERCVEYDGYKTYC